MAEAQRIFHQHLRLGAGEAVNIDSKARQCAEQNLHNVNATIFAAAQKQIFNLMKFDSYTRFLKSDLYKQCLAGKGEDYKLDPNLNLQITSAKPKRSLSNAEDRRRKSLLPWHRKNRSKSKECGDEPKPLQHDVNENFSSSKSSLTSLDIGISSNSVRKQRAHSTYTPTNNEHDNHGLKTNTLPTITEITSTDHALSTKQGEVKSLKEILLRAISKEKRKKLEKRFSSISI